jgi:hypothetical protein
MPVERRVGRRSGRSGHPRPGRLIQNFRPLWPCPRSRRVTAHLGPREALVGLVIVRVAVAALADQRPTGQLWCGRLQAGVGRSRQGDAGTARPRPATRRSTSWAEGSPWCRRRQPGRNGRARHPRRPSPSSKVKGRVTASPPSDPSAGRQRPSYQDPPGSRVLLGGSWPSWALPLNSITSAFHLWMC